MLTWAELSSIYCTCRWGRVWIQRDWEGEGSLRGENLANKVGSSSFKPAASFLCAQPSPRKGAWGSTGCREDMSLAGFLQLPSCPVTERGKATEGDKQGMQKYSFKELDLRLSPLEEEGEKSNVLSNITGGSSGACTERPGKGSWCTFSCSKQRESS